MLFEITASDQIRPASVIKMGKLALAHRFPQTQVLAAIQSSPTPVRSLVVTAEPVTSIDVTAADAVCELDDTLGAAGIHLYSPS